MKRVLSLTLALLMLVTGWIMPVSASETATVEGFDILVTDGETTSGYIAQEEGIPVPTLNKTLAPTRGGIVAFTHAGSLYSEGGWANPAGHGIKPTNGVKIAYRAPAALDVSAMSYFVFDLYVSHPDKVQNVNFWLELTSSGRSDVQEHNIRGTLDAIKGSAIHVGWNRIYLALDRLTKPYDIAEGLDTSAWNYFRLFNSTAFDAGEEFVLAIDNIGFAKKAYEPDLEDFETEITLGSSEELAIVDTSKGGSLNSVGRYADRTAYFTYAFPAAKLAQAERVLWTAATYSQLLLQVSGDGVNFKTVYSYNIDLDTLIASGDNSGNSALAGWQMSQLPAAVRTYNLTEAIRETVAEDSDTVYIRIGDSYPYAIVKEQDGTYSEDTAGTSGIQCGSGGMIVRSQPMKLTVSYPWGTVKPSVTDTISFYPASTNGDDLPYLYENAASRATNGTQHFADGTSHFTYAYPVRNIQNANSIVWSAKAGNQLLLEASVDNTNWIKLYSFADEKTPQELYEAGQFLYAPITDRSFDITDKIKSVATAETDTVYIRISDAYPYAIVQKDNGDGTYSYVESTTISGFGGNLNAGSPVKFTVNYNVDPAAQTALGRKVKYTFTPADSSPAGGTKFSNTAGTEYPYVVKEVSNPSRHGTENKYYCDNETQLVYGFALEEGAVPTKMTFTGAMGVQLTLALSNVYTGGWVRAEVRSPEEIAAGATNDTFLQPFNKYRTVDLMTAYKNMDWNATTGMVYVRFGDANYPEKADGCGSQLWGTSKATFECTYFWHPERMSAGKALAFNSAALVLTEDFDIGFKITAPAAYTNLQVRAGVEGEQQKTIETTADGTMRKFTYEHIYAHNLSDKIVTSLVASYNGRPAIVHLAYGVRNYCENMIENYGDDKTFCTLLSDVLAYGAAAQVYADYKTDDLATSVDVPMTPTAFDAAKVTGKREVTGTKSDVVDWTSATLVLGSTMQVDMMFTATSTAGLTVGVQCGDRLEEIASDIVPLGGGKYKVSYAVMAHEFFDTLTAKFYVNGTPTGRTLSYSVGGYINHTYPTAGIKLSALLESIANYGVSVNAYIAEHPELAGADRNEDNVTYLAPTSYASAAEYNRAVALNGDSTNLTLLQSVMNRAKAGENITVATIGGSITAGSSSSNYATKSYAAHFKNWWQTTFPQTTVTLVNAGIGATTSHLGVHRVADHVIAKSPDVCIVEFSVNDFTDSYYAETYEGLIAQLLNNDIAVMLVFTVNQTGASEQLVHSTVGAKYQLPMISYGDAIFPTITAGQRTWTDISPDNIHPNDYGHAYIGELLWKYLNNVYAYTPDEVTVQGYDKEALQALPYFNAELLGPVETADTSVPTPTLTGMFEVDEASLLSSFQGSWKANPELAVGNVNKMSFQLTFSKLGVLYTRTIDGLSGVCDVYVDGTKVASLNGDFSGGWGNYQCSAEVFSSDEVKERTVTFKMADPTKAFTLVRIMIAGCDTAE